MEALSLHGGMRVALRGEAVTRRERTVGARGRCGAASVVAKDFPKPDLETANYRCARD